MKADLSNEKLNNNWQKQLEDVSSLSDVTLQNKNAAWEKLHARLHEKPAQKRAVWYWLAAACLFFAMAIPLTMHQRTTPLVKNNHRGNDVRKSLVIKDESFKTVVAKAPVIQTQHQSQKNIIVTADTKKHVITDSLFTAAPVVIANNDNRHNQNIATALSADTTAATTVLLKSIQKKLKVVHVNELGEPVEFPAAVVHNADLHLFQLKLAQEEIYNASKIASNNNSGLSFKPKNFPN